MRNINTSYTSFGFCLDDLRKRLHTLHQHIDGAQDQLLVGQHVVSKQVHSMVDVLSCLLRDIESKHIDYTNKPSSMVDVTDASIIKQAYTKAYAKVIHTLDDYYVEFLHAPMWVCRHKLENGEQFWAISNIANEVALIANTADQTVSMMQFAQITH